MIFLYTENSPFAFYRRKDTEKRESMQILFRFGGHSNCLLPSQRSHLSPKALFFKSMLIQHFLLRKEYTFQLSEGEQSTSQQELT